MKPVYLEFCGINSFSEKAVIDFRDLLSGGVFGIFGDTGSGKSTILDCIHLALYGQIERSSGSECIHYRLDSAYVIFDFEITTEGVRHTYRVKRERRRKNNTAKAYLYEYTEAGGLLALAEGTRDVNDRLEGIIGLTFADFKMCIALPQGDFAALVKAPTSERVKLVSRLFDLEKYGEKLFKSVNAKYYRAEEAVNLVKAKMEQNDGGGEEAIAQKQAEVEACKLALRQADEDLKSAETAYEKSNALQKEKEEYEALARRLQALTERLPEMRVRREEAEKLPVAKAVCREAEAVESNRREIQRAKEDATRAEESLQRAILAVQEKKDKQKEGDFDEKILSVSVALDKVRGAAADLQSEAEFERKYKECLREYKTLSEQCPADDFEGIRKALERELTALGEDETLLDYLRHNCKDLLLGETYGEIRADLSALAVKYPMTEADVKALLKKYTLARTDDRTFDLAEIQLAFRQMEQKRKEVRKKLENNEQRKLAYFANEERKKILFQQGTMHHEAWEAAKCKTEQIKELGSVEALENKLKVVQAQKLAAQSAVDEAQERVNALRAEKEKQNALFKKATETAETLSAALEKILTESGFASAGEAAALIKKLGDERVAKAECKEFFERYESLKTRFEETDAGKFVNFDEAALARARAEKAAAQAARDNLHKRIAAVETELSRLLVLREKYKEFEKELAEKEKERKLCDELRILLKGNRFLEFIASEYLQDVCVAASRTLLSLTGGRYFLKYEKEFKVGDNLDGGNLRAVKTLSGGETFLVSLSLALSLSGAICQKSLRPIEFFFLDEGFGTLDGNLVDTVMDVLGKLSKDFAVGLISHVEELKHRIDNKILVTGANESHGSRVRAERF